MNINEFYKTHYSLCPDIPLNKVGINEDMIERMGAVKNIVTILFQN